MARTPTQPRAPHRDRALRVRQLLRQPLFADAAFLWAYSVLPALGGAAFWPLVARLYSSDQVGLGAATTSAIALMAALAHLGLGTGLVRYLPGAGEARPHLVNFALTVSSLAGLVAAVIFIAGTSWWSPGLAYLRERPIDLISFIVFTTFSTAVYVPTMALIVLRSGRYIVVAATITQVGRLLLAVMLFSFGTFGIVAAGGLATIAGLVASMAFLSLAMTPFRPTFLLRHATAISLFPYGLANHVADTALMCPLLILPIMVVNTRGSVSGAHFYMAFFMGTLLILAVQSLATSLFAEGSRHELGMRSAVRHALLGGLAIAVIGGAVMALIGDRLLVIFGEGYVRESANLVHILALTGVPASIMSIYFAVLRVNRRMLLLICVSLVSAMVTLSASYLLLPDVGITAPGVGVLAGQGVGALFGLTYFISGRSNILRLSPGDGTLKSNVVRPRVDT